MKRLLGLLGLTCLVVLTACFYLGENAALILGAGSVVLFIISMLIPAVRKEKTLPIGFITSVIAITLFLGYGRFFVEPLKVYDEKTCDVVAVQKDEVYFSNGYYHYELDVKEIDGNKVNTGLLLRSKYHTYSKAFDELRFKTELYFTENGSQKAKRLFFNAYIFDEGTVEVISPDNRPIKYHFIALKEKLANALYLEMDYDTAAFSSSVLLGDKYAMEPQVKSLLRDAGLSHISVVSGLHLSIIALICRKVFGSVFKRRTLSGGLTILVIVSFAAVCGFSPSVIRAGVMLIICIIGTMIYRKSDSLNSLGLAALVLTLFNPYSVGDIGMLLSFAATIGIVLWSSKISNPVMNTIEKFSCFKLRYINKLVRLIVNTFSMSLCATIWTLPIIVFVYTGISAVSLLANILIVPFMWPVLLLIALCALTHFVGFLEVMCNVIAFLVSLFYNYLIFVCESLTSLPFAFVNSNKPYFYIWISLTLIIIAVAVIVGKRWFNVLTVLLSLLILFTGSLNYRIAMKNKLVLHVPYTGSGLSVILESDAGYAVLRGEGKKTKVFTLNNKLETIKNNKDNIYVDLPGDNSDFYADYIMNEFDYQHVLRYDNMEVDDKSHIINFTDNHSLELWDKASVQFFVCGDGVVEYLFAGDTRILILSDEADCSLLPEEYRMADMIITSGIPYNYQFLSCETIMVAGEGYICEASAEVMSSICTKIIKGKDLIYEIDIS